MDTFKNVKHLIEIRYDTTIEAYIAFYPGFPLVIHENKTIAQEHLNYLLDNWYI